MCPFPPPEPPQPPNRIRQRSNSPSACQKVIRRQPNSGGSSQFQDRKSTRLNSSHGYISYAVFGFKKKDRHSRTCCPGKSAATFCVETPLDPVVPSNTTFLGFIKEGRILFPAGGQTPLLRRYAWRA